MRDTLERRPDVLAKNGISMNDIDAEDIDGYLCIPGLCCMEESYGNDADAKLSDVLIKLRDANMLTRMIGKTNVAIDEVPELAPALYSDDTEVAAEQTVEELT